MTTMVSFHAAYDGIEPTDMRFSATDPSRDNSNALRMIFESGPKAAELRQELTVFHLDDDTADCLAKIGRLDAAHRSELVPILEHMLSVQAAEAEANDG